MSDLQAIIDSMLDVNWTPLAEVVQEHGQAWVRVTIMSNGVQLEALAPSSMHCATCQCNKLHDTAKRVLTNPQSKTWHW